MCCLTAFTDENSLYIIGTFKGVAWLRDLEISLSRGRRGIVLDDPEDDEGQALGACADLAAVGARRCRASAAPSDRAGVLNK